MARTIIVQVQAHPAPVDLDVVMSPDSWSAYQGAIWISRLNAQLQCIYFARVRRALGACRLALELIVVLGSMGAIGTLLAGAPAVVAMIASGCVAIASGLLQVSGLPDRVRNAAELVAAWSDRIDYWNDAWLLVRSGHYLGALSNLSVAETKLADVEEALGFPSIESWQRAAQQQVIDTDHLVLSHRATASN